MSGKKKRRKTCKAKVSYPSSDAAQRAADAQRGRVHGYLLRPYRCEICKGWHLSAKPWVKQRRRRW